MNLSHVIVELDAKVVVSFLSSSSKIHPKLWALVNNRRLLLRSLHNAQVHHAFREANRSADALASLGQTQDDDFVIYLSPRLY